MNERITRFLFAMSRSSVSASHSLFAAGNERPIEPNIFRDRGVDQCVEVFETDVCAASTFLFHSDRYVAV